MAKQGWLKGWPGVRGAHWAKPIQFVLAEEDRDARAAMGRDLLKQQKVASDDAAALREEAVKRRQAMLEIAKGIRGTLGNAVASLYRLGPVLVKVAETFANDLPKLQALDPRDKLRIVKEYISAEAMLAESYARLDAIARLDDEKPTAIIGVEVSDMTQEQAVEAIEHAQSMLELLREEGLIKPTDEKAGPNGSGNGLAH